MGSWRGLAESWGVRKIAWDTLAGDDRGIRRGHTQMKLLRLFVFAVAAIHVSGAQEKAQVAAPSSEATLHYIHDAWDTLTRSMTDCHSLVDIKVTANPILYLPAGMQAPPEVKALTEKCHVKVQSLPRRIDKLGDVMPDELPVAGLLYLPRPYVVPG